MIMRKEKIINYDALMERISEYARTAGRVTTRPVLLLYLPPSGEIQSAASDKISHSRVCYTNFAAKVIIFFVNLSPIAQILQLYARFCLRLRPQPLNLTSSCRTSWQPEADSR